MFPNPKPAVDAVDRLGGLPGIFFSSPLVAGFFAMIMLPVFGGVAGAFFSFIEPGIGGVELFEAGRAGAMLAVALGLVIFAGVFVSALFLPQERTSRLMFFFGGAVGLGALVALDAYASDAVRAALIG